MADIKFFIQYRGRQKVVLPVNPEKFEVSGPGTNQVENVVELGDINILKLPGLRTVSIEAWIPKQYPSGARYIVQDAPQYNAQFYIDLLRAIQQQKEPITLVVSGLNVSIEMGIEQFDYRWEGTDEDMWYKLSLKEWKAYEASVAEVSTSTRFPTPRQPGTKRENTSGEISIGSKVIVNGRLYKSSTGASPGVTEKNATRLISHIAKGAPYPYHVTTLDGGWRGWVTAGSVRLVE